MSATLYGSALMQTPLHRVAPELRALDAISGSRPSSAQPGDAGVVPPDK
jgi:hypothetical protein